MYYNKKGEFLQLSSKVLGSPLALLPEARNRAGVTSIRTTNP